MADIVNLVALCIGSAYQNIHFTVAHTVLGCYFTANLCGYQLGGGRRIQLEAGQGRVIEINFELRVTDPQTAGYIGKTVAAFQCLLQRVGTALEQR